MKARSGAMKRLGWLLLGSVPLLSFRHLPDLKFDERKQMEKLSPKGPRNGNRKRKKRNS
jgi:hypothetical protein